ncbi:hypothetical protein [Streptomyces sp. YIM B13518]
MVAALVVARAFRRTSKHLVGSRPAETTAQQQTDLTPRQGASG